MQCINNLHICYHISWVLTSVYTENKYGSFERPLAIRYLSIYVGTSGRGCFPKTTQKYISIFPKFDGSSSYSLRAIGVHTDKLLIPIKQINSLLFLLPAALNKRLDYLQSEHSKHAQMNATFLFKLCFFEL